MKRFYSNVLVPLAATVPGSRLELNNVQCPFPVTHFELKVRGIVMATDAAPILPSVPLILTDFSLCDNRVVSVTPVDLAIVVGGVTYSPFRIGENGDVFEHIFTRPTAIGTSQNFTILTPGSALNLAGSIIFEFTFYGE